MIDQPLHRSGVDDATEAARLHAGDGEPGGVERRRQVDGEDLVPFLDRKILDRGDFLNAGIVDHHVEGADVGLGGGHQLGNFARLGHVGAVIGDADPMGRGEPRAQGLDFVRVAEPVEHDVHSRFRESFGDALADAAGRTGDDGVEALGHNRDSVGGGAFFVQLGINLPYYRGATSDNRGQLTKDW